MPPFLHLQRLPSFPSLHWAQTWIWKPLSTRLFLNIIKSIWKHHVISSANNWIFNHDGDSYQLTFILFRVQIWVSNLTGINYASGCYKSVHNTWRYYRQMSHYIPFVNPTKLTEYQHKINKRTRIFFIIVIAFFHSNKKHGISNVIAGFTQTG